MTERRCIIFFAAMALGCLIAAWVYRGLPAVDDTVAPMRGARDGGL